MQSSLKASDREECKKIYILKHRWHTGIIIERAELKNILSALEKDFLSSQYIEIGWGDKDFYKRYFSTSYYYSPIDKIVLELKGRAGIANNYGDTDTVPIYERFYAGGANTIRGYKERKIGPRDPASNDPIGGESTLIGNLEVHFPIYEKVIKGAVFYDVGNVWSQLEDFAQGSYKQGVGVGLRLKTPIGPLKLDWGYPLNENQGDEKEGSR